MSILTVNHNVAALNTQRNLEVNSFNLAKSLQKLSSGFRINVAADGPADLVISEGLRAQIGGLNAALRNTQEASNYLGIAEGALQEVNNLLVSMRVLAVHAANTGMVTTAQVTADQAELTNANAAITRIGLATRFAGQAVFTAAARTFHIGEGSTSGAGSADEVTLPTGSLAFPANPTTIALGATGLTANLVIAAIDIAIAGVATRRATLGAFQKNTLMTNVNSLSVALENVTATESYIRDANMAQETSEYTKNQILVQAGVAVLAQANVASQSVLALLK
jgi:flagellin